MMKLRLPLLQKNAIAGSETKVLTSNWKHDNVVLVQGWRGDRWVWSNGGVVISRERLMNSEKNRPSYTSSTTYLTCSLGKWPNNRILQTQYCVFGFPKRNFPLDRQHNYWKWLSVFWDVAPCSQKLTDVSEVLIASITVLMMQYSRRHHPTHRRENLKSRTEQLVSTSLVLVSHVMGLGDGLRMLCPVLLSRLASLPSTHALTVRSV
jgi:hypothetical protein